MANRYRYITLQDRQEISKRYGRGERAADITLIATVAPEKPEQEVDANGFEVEAQEQRTEVFANVRSAGTNEFYKAQQAGTTVTMKADVHTEEYDGQTTAEYAALAGKTVTPANLKAGTTKLNLRAEATAGSKQICRVALGEKMQCMSLAGEWALCTYGDIRGYCMAKFLQAAEDSGSAGTDNALYTALEARVAALEKLVVGEAGTGWVTIHSAFVRSENIENT